jgi:hypothetical protein
MESLTFREAGGVGRTAIFRTGPGATAWPRGLQVIKRFGGPAGLYYAVRARMRAAIRSAVRRPMSFSAEQTL